MSIASEITRLQGVKSDILTAIADKGVTVPAGSALDDCPGLISQISGDVPIQGTVELFGKTYNTIKINGLEWICDNLDYLPPTISNSHTSSGSPQAFYRDDSETTWGWSGRKCGLLYNYEGQQEIKNYLSDGWRLMTLNDCGRLIASVTNYTISGKSLSKSVDWSTITGTDDIGFGLKPYGAWEPVSGYNNGNFLAIDSYNGVKYMANRREENELPNIMDINLYSGIWFNVIRLCRDIA